MRNKERTYPFTIGYDGEFVYEKPGNILVSAEEISPHKDGRIGTDGWTDIAEVRGGAYFKTKELVADIEQSFRNHMPPKGLQYAWRIGAFPLGMPTGMHMHFGIHLRDNLKSTIQSILGVYFTLIEPKPDGQLRYEGFKGKGYGKLDFFMDKPSYGFEYKMPWAFYGTPDLTEKLFTFSSLIVLLSSYGLTARCTDKIKTAFETRDYETLKLPLLKIVSNLQNENKTIELLRNGEQKEVETLIDNNKFYSEQELEVLDFIENTIRNNWEFGDDVDLRDSWSKSHETPGVIYSDKFIEYKNETKGKLKVFYVRPGDNNKFCVTISRLSMNEGVLDKLVERLGGEGISVKVLNNTQETYRCCPTLNISPKLMHKLGKEVNDIVKLTQGVLSE